MRKLGFTLILMLSGAAAVLACSSTEGDPEVAADDLSDQDLARKALVLMGAPQLPREGADAPSCAFTGCHSISGATLKGWALQFKEAMEILDSDRPNEEKINYFRQNPNDPRTGFTPERIGPMTAGVHLALGANVNETRHPETFKQGKKFAEIFRGKEELYSEFRREMLMPVLPDYPRLTPAQYEVVLKWFQKGIPHANDFLQEAAPTKCEDKFDDLRARTVAVKNETWAAKNFSNRLPMFACPAPNPEAPVSPTKCFTQKKGNKDIFLSAADDRTFKVWPQDGSTIRVLREFSAPNSFWVRTSADGRFAATGGGRRGGAQAMDLQATLEGQPPRDIDLEAQYDPDFWPDNKAFMFQGGTRFCAQSLLEKAGTRSVNFGEAECSSLSQASGLYQTVGQVVGDNSLSDRFILYSIWAGDSGSYSASARDTPPRGGKDAAIQIYTAVAKGNDVEEGYQITGEPAKIATPYRGDTMMGRSGKLIGSRWAYGEDADGKVAGGYALEQLERKIVGGKYEFTLKPLGNVCLHGNKANISFDERFLATHHYNAPEDYEASERSKYAEKGSSDVIVVDFYTGKKMKVAKMGPGQFALYPHFRSDGWLYFLVVDHNERKFMMVASDWAVRQVEANPTQ